jgi:alanine-glyoxylate transaminase/serine-glyoxylate transaminase/serine-pyruvate transaminase
VYHHTPSAHLLYALNAALGLIEDEGLAERWARHRRVAAGLAAGCEALGLSLLVDPADRLAPLTAVCVPEGVDDAAVRTELLQRFGVEIAGGLGELRGRIWRVGLMGTSAQERYVVLFLSALGSILARHGVRCDTTAAQDAAMQAWAE